MADGQGLGPVATEVLDERIASGWGRVGSDDPLLSCPRCGSVTTLAASLTHELACPGRRGDRIKG